MITYDEVIDTGREVIKDKDDFVYQPDLIPIIGRSAKVCLYVRDGEASCIAAQILNRLGTPIETLELWDGNSNGSNIRIVARDRPFDIEPAALDFLGDLQGYQDNELSWGESFRKAYATAESYKKRGVQPVDEPEDDVLGSTQHLQY